MITEDLQNLYQTYLGEVPEEIVELPSSGSNRRYFRLTGTQKLIGVYGTSKEERNAAQDHPLTAFYPICRSRRL